MFSNPTEFGKSQTIAYRVHSTFPRLSNFIDVFAKQKKKNDKNETLKTDMCFLSFIFHSFFRVCSVRYRYSRYRYGYRTELTEVTGSGIDVPNLPKCPVPVLMLYRNSRSVRYRYESLYRYRRYRYPCTELTEVSGTGIDVPNLPKCPVPVLMSYRTHRSVRYRY